jgi:hypothetical protein
MRQQIVRFLLAYLLFMQSVLPCALAQTGETQTANDGLTAERVFVEGSPTRRHEDIAHSEAGQTPSELAHQRPVAPVPPRIRYPRTGSPRGAWQPRNRRHALIGALIGFGIGAALGAKGNRDQHTSARIAAPMLVGGVGAMIGAAVGSSVP